MKTGIYDNMRIEDYHADRSVMSSTALKMAKKSSRHLGHYIVHGTERKSAFSFGNAFELGLMDAIRNTKDFGQNVTVFDPENRPEKEKGITSKKNQEWKKGLFESGGYVINRHGETESKEAMDQMIASVLAEPMLATLTEEAEYQKSFVWKDGETGIMCKTRPDLILKDRKVIIDVKTTKDASPSGFARESANYDYPSQAIMQMDGVIKSGYLDTVEEYLWLVVEKSAPYNAVLYRLQDEDKTWLIDSYEYYLNRCASVLKDLKDHQGIYAFCDSYSENADNKYGVLDLELPLYYKS